MVGLLAHHKNADGAPLTSEKIAEHLLLLFWAGYDTTATTGSWLLHELAKAPEWQERLVAEQERSLGGAKATMEQLDGMAEHGFVLKEVERMRPAVIFFPRRTTDEVEFAGRKIPKDTFLFWSPYLTHRVPELFPDPERLIPCAGATPAARRPRPARSWWLRRRTAYLSGEGVRALAASGDDGRAPAQVQLRARSEVQAGRGSTSDTPAQGRGGDLPPARRARRSGVVGNQQPRSGGPRRVSGRDLVYREGPDGSARFSHKASARKGLKRCARFAPSFREAVGGAVKSQAMVTGPSRAPPSPFSSARARVSGFFAPRIASACSFW